MIFGIARPPARLASNDGVRRQRQLVVDLEPVGLQDVMDLGPITRLRGLGGWVQSRCIGLAL